MTFIEFLFFLIVNNISHFHWIIRALLHFVVTKGRIHSHLKTSSSWLSIENNTKGVKRAYMVILPYNRNSNDWCSLLQYNSTLTECIDTLVSTWWEPFSWTICTRYKALHIIVEFNFGRFTTVTCWPKHNHVWWLRIGYQCTVLVSVVAMATWRYDRNSTSSGTF